MKKRRELWELVLKVLSSQQLVTLVAGGCGGIRARVQGLPTSGAAHYRRLLLARGVQERAVHVLVAGNLTMY